MPIGPAAIGSASPSVAALLVMISRHASAMIAPPEYASGFTHATVLLMRDCLMEVQMSRTAPTSPPGVSRSKTIAPAPPASAILIRRATLWAVTRSIGPWIVMTATFSAGIEAVGAWVGVADP
jgi:hypothetical protein